MTTLQTVATHFMGASPTAETAPWVLVGLPYDGTCTYRPGTRFGPGAIREASWGLETYSPVLDSDLENIVFSDAGDLDLPFGNRELVLERIGNAARTVLNKNQSWFGLGGEHLATLPVVEAYLNQYPDLCVIQFDAHADLRADYLGETLSHATVMRRIVDKIGPERFTQIGIRSGPKTEFAWMRTHQTLMTSPEMLKSRLQALGNKPVYLTIDLDVLDPSVLPGTGTPEPGGMTFSELQQWLVLLKGLNFVGMDVMELAPHYDQTGVSSVVAAKVVRECLLLLPETR